MVLKVQINNGEKITSAGLSVFDSKGKAIPDGGLEPGTTVVFTASQDPSTVAQFVQSAPNSLVGDITTVGDDIGVVLFTGTIQKPDGTLVMDSDGTIPQYEVTVVNGPPNTASFTAGTVQPE